MPIYFPDILQNNNPNYPLTDITEVRGNAYPITNLSGTGSIPENKRKIGNIIFVSSAQKFYGYFGSTTGSSDWNNSNNWRELAIGSALGNFVTTGSAGVNQVISGSITIQQGITGSVQTASFTPNAFTTASYTNGTLNLIKGDLTSASFVINSGSFSGSFFGTASWAQNALTASFFSGSISNAINAATSSYPIVLTGSTLYSYGSNVNSNISYNVSPTDNIFFGTQAGVSVTGATHTSSIFIGKSAGQLGGRAYRSIYLGELAGANSFANTQGAVFIGYSAGQQTSASFSNFIGYGAGAGATNIFGSTIIGYNAGLYATSASYSIIIGWNAGTNLISSAASPGSNNIIIGTGVTLDAGRRNSINIGGIIFGTGSYSSTAFISSGSANGRIGINVVNPQYTLDVEGTLRFGGLQNSSSVNLLAYDSASGAVYYIPTSSLSSALPTFPYTGSAAITGSLTVTGSTNILGDVNVIGTGSFTNVVYQNIQVINAVSTGSNTFGDTVDDTQRLIGIAIVTGSLQVTGSTNLSGTLNVSNGISGSLFGTASWAHTASVALNSISASFATTSSFSISSSFAQSSSYSFTSSFATSASWAPATAGGSDTEIQFNNNGQLDGDSTLIFNYQSQSFQQGLNAVAFGIYSFAQGEETKAIGRLSHAEGNNTDAGFLAHSASLIAPNIVRIDGDKSSQYTNGEYVPVFNPNNPLVLSSSLVLGKNYDGSTYTYVTTSISHTGPSILIYIGENGNAVVSGGTRISTGSHAEGYYSIAQGFYSHAEGQSTQAIGDESHAEGYFTTTVGKGAHAEGASTQAIGNYSHAEGDSSNAIGEGSHVEGFANDAYGDFSHAEGYFTIASGAYSHTAGRQTLSISSYQSVIGQYNRGTIGDGAFIIGNGANNTNRSNLLFASGTQFQISGSLFISGAEVNSAGGNILTYDTASGRVYYTSSAGLGGGGPESDPIFTARSASLATTGSNTFTAGQIISGSLDVTQGITGSLLGTASWAQNSLTSSYPFYAVTNSIYSFNAENKGDTTDYINGGPLSANVIIGANAFSGSTGDVSATIAIGNEAGQSSAGSDQNIFIGRESGKLSELDSVVAIGGWQTAYSSSNIDSTVAIGRQAGAEVINSKNSVFIGECAGHILKNSLGFQNGANVFIGLDAGDSGVDITDSLFTLDSAGLGAKYIIGSNFIGQYAGGGTVSASYSTLIGQRVGFNESQTEAGSIGSNNIIIGTNITLPAGRKDSINLGGILFGTGSFADPSPVTSPFSGSMGGRIGINVVNPQYTLDVSGSGNYIGALRISGSLYISGASVGGGSGHVLTYDNTTGLVTYTSSAGLGGGSGTPGGNSGEIQYNNAGAFGGVPVLTYTGGNLIATGSFTGSFTGSLFGTASWAQSASVALNTISASFATTASFALNVNNVIAATGSTLYSLTPLSTNTPNTTHSIFLGSGSGLNTTFAFNSNFFGQQAGQGATRASDSNFLGSSAGRLATQASASNFFGQQAGLVATNASNSNFFGQNAGGSATNASNSNFFGETAGEIATNASHSNFMGYCAGRQASNASYSNLFGYQVARSVAIGPNNIIIGTNITLGVDRRNSINIGGIIFGTGSYFNTSSIIPFSGSANGRIGINVENPQYNFEVSGTVGFPNLQTTGSISNVVLIDTTTGQLYYTSSAGLGGGSTTQQDRIVTGSVTASVNTTGNIFTVASSSINLMTVSSSGMITIANSGSVSVLRLYNDTLPVIETPNNELVFKQAGQDRFKIGANITTNVPIRFGTPDGLINSSTTIQNNADLIGLELRAGTSGSITGSVRVVTGRLVTDNGLTVTGSLFISGTTQSGGNGNVLTYDTSTGQVYYTASNAIGGGSGGPESDPIFTARSASLATTGSNTFRGDQTISGSLDVSGSGRFTNNVTIANSNNDGVRLTIGTNPTIVFTADPGVDRITLTRENNDGLSFGNPSGFIGHIVRSGWLVGGTDRFDLESSTRLKVTGNTLATSSIARGINLQSTLTAAANNDTLIGLDVNPTFVSGAFTGVDNIAARVRGNVVTTGSLNVSGSGRFTNGLTVSGSLFISGTTQSGGNGNVLTYDTTTGQVYYTSSVGLGGGTSALKTKSGGIANTSFGGPELTASVTFGTAFADNNYAVTITGEDSRTWTIQSKTSGSFVVNSNSSVALTGTTFWIATAYGEN